MADSRGKFVWYELMTTDADQAEAFYGDVVGWSTAPFDNGSGMDYRMWMAGETPVGGLMALPEEAREQGAPPAWMAHVTVPDVDATAARVTELGGRIVHGPEDIPEVGRFAVFTDPQGAMLSAFRPGGDMEGPAATGPGTFSWRELGTTDYEAALDFYSDLFGWEAQEAMDMGENGVYQMYGPPGETLGGMYTKTADMPGPPAWLYYVLVEDLDGAIGRIENGGGSVLMGPHEVPGGDRIVVAQDPQGAVFALHERKAAD